MGSMIGLVLFTFIGLPLLFRAPWRDLYVNVRMKMRCCCRHWSCWVDSLCHWLGIDWTWICDRHDRHIMGEIDFHRERQGFKAM